MGEQPEARWEDLGRGHGVLHRHAGKRGNHGLGEASENDLIIVRGIVGGYVVANDRAVLHYE